MTIMHYNGMNLFRFWVDLPDVLYWHVKLGSLVLARGFGRVMVESFVISVEVRDSDCKNK